MLSKSYFRLWLDNGSKICYNDTIDTLDECVRKCSTTVKSDRSVRSANTSIGPEPATSGFADQRVAMRRRSASSGRLAGFGPSREGR
jgi:hypothetical protein